MTDIAELGIKIEASDIRSAVKELNRLDKNANKAEKSTNKLSRATSALRGKMGALITVAGAIGYARLTKSSIEYADTIAKTADKLGVTTDALQEYRYAAERSGVQQTALDMGLQRFSRRLGEADKGMGELKGTMLELGISTRDSAGNIRTAEDVLQEYAGAIQNAEGDQEKLRLAFKAFDSEGAAMVNMLRNGAEGLNELRQQAVDSGVVMDAQLIRKAEVINDKWDTLTQTIGVKFKSALIEIAAPLFNVQTNMERLAEIEIELARAGNELNAAIGRGAEGISGYTQTLKELQEEKAKLLEVDKKLAEEESGDKKLQAMAESLHKEHMLEIETKDKLRAALITHEAGTLEEQAHLRRQAKAQMLLDEEAAERTATQNAQAAIMERVGYMQQTMGNLSSLMSSKNEKLWKLGKAAALSSALINTSLAITKTMSSVPYPWNIPLAAAQGLAGMVQVQNIRSQQFSGQAHSGLDNVPREGTYLLQKGEMVLDAGTSEQVRNNATGGGSLNVTINTVDAEGVDRLVMNHGEKFYNAVQSQMYENNQRFA